MNNTRSAVLLRLALAVGVATAPVTVALAQERGAFQQQNEGRAGRSGGSLAVPVSGTVTPHVNPTMQAPVAGTFTIQRFERSGDGIVGVGTLTATFVDPLTNATRTIVTQTSLPLNRELSGGAASAPPAAEAEDVPERGPAVAMQPACDVLNLVLGPLDLNLLGLRIQLNQVVLDITAVPGPGNLLGNLLCAIVGILDGAGPLGQLVALLNGLLALLG
jgi:hypothetical protein